MAFVSTPVPLLRAPRAMATSRHVPVMTASPSRRAVLQWAVTAATAAALATPAFAESIKDDLKELKKDVEELKYDEEVVDVGPDDREKNPLRIKKKVPEPEYRVEEKEDLEADDKAFDAMVAKEKDDANALRAKFSKK